MSHFFLFSSPSFAESVPNAELEGILRKIESRHYRWIAIRADVLLFFATAKDSSAMCGGELLYQRLDERMFLVCVDMQKELVFAFRTLDRQFDLYLPAQNTVYHGSIFDLEDSPDIESHLKARDLYRALKPMAVDPRRAKVERANSAITSLDVYGPKGAEETLTRKLYLSPEGDVRGEIFFGPDGHPATEIQRYDFRTLPAHVGLYDSVIFPKKITILSPETGKGSAIFFTAVKALDTIDPLEFILRVPYGTKEVFLDEKDSRFQNSKAEAATPTQQAAPVQQAVPVYLAKPLKRSPSKTTRPPSREKQGGKETPEAPKQESSPVATSNILATVSNEPKPTENADADIAVEDKSPADTTSAYDNQLSLDPSIEPKA